jgi:hypothetical protein
MFLLSKQLLELAILRIKKSHKRKQKKRNKDRKKRKARCGHRVRPDSLSRPDIIRKRIGYLRRHSPTPHLTADKGND